MRLVLLLAALAATPTCAPLPGERGATPVTVLDEPGFERLLDNADGGLLVVNLFATWCSACRGELPVLDRYAQDAPEIDFAAVSLDEAGKTAEVRSYASTLRLGLPVFHLSVPDPVSTVGRHLDAFHGGIPVTAVLGEGGRVLAMHAGRVGRTDLEDLLARARSKTGG